MGSTEFGSKVGEGTSGRGVSLARGTGASVSSMGWKGVGVAVESGGTVTSISAVGEATGIRSELFPKVAAQPFRRKMSKIDRRMRFMSFG